MVESIPMIAEAFQDGLKAIEKKDSSKIKASDTRKLSGSVYLDEKLKGDYPHDARWDYIIGYDEKVYFAEVHPANTSNVDEVIKKKNWLASWLNAYAKVLKDNMVTTSYHWLASGKIAILKNSPQYRRLAKNKLFLCKELKLG